MSRLAQFKSEHVPFSREKLISWVPTDRRMVEIRYIRNLFFQQLGTELDPQVGQFTGLTHFLPRAADAHPILESLVRHRLEEVLVVLREAEVIVGAHVDHVLYRLPCKPAKKNVTLLIILYPPLMLTVFLHS